MLGLMNPKSTDPPLGCHLCGRHTVSEPCFLELGNAAALNRCLFKSGGLKEGAFSLLQEKAAPIDEGPWGSEGQREASGEKHGLLWGPLWGSEYSDLDVWIPVIFIKGALIFLSLSLSLPSTTAAILPNNRGHVASEGLCWK
jgi:hypothetical protein